jgi:hypothetical protein
MSDVKRPWTITRDKTRMTEKPPLGPGFSIEEAEMADSMSLTFSSFSAPGEDWTEFVLHNHDGSKITATRIIKGY